MRTASAAVLAAFCLAGPSAPALASPATDSPATGRHHLTRGFAATPKQAKAARTRALARQAAARKAATKRKAAAARGPRGPQGAKGRPGAVGTTGATGAPGAVGAPGAQGPVGTTGAPGAQGPVGATGAPGGQGAPGAPGAQGPAGPPAPAPADGHLRVLAFNDFHGNLEPPTGSSGTTPSGVGQSTPTGGAAYLATHLKSLQAGQEDSVVVGAGDLLGASPLVSGLFHDEPAIEVLNAMGMRYAGVGNHEFDEGVSELLRLQHGGCHPVDGCQDGDPFAGAAFRYLAANARYADTDRTILPPYMVKRVKGIPVAFVGVTLRGTPKIVTPEGVEGIVFDDEAEAVNRLVRQLADSDEVEAFVVLIHQGGQQNPPYAAGFQDPDRCDNVTGDIHEVVDRLDSRVDAVISAHTHQPYICDRGGKLITSASSFGRLITRVDLTLDGTTHDVRSISADNVLVTRTVAEDPAVKTIVDKYKALAAPIAARVIGSITATISRTSNAAAESPLGDVIADSQLDATRAPAKGGSVIAFMNPGGIRADLPFNAPSGSVTYNDAYTVQPFANTLVVKTLTGAQIKALLEQQFDNPTAGQRRVLQVSNGFAYRYDQTQPAGSRVDASSITIGGTTVDPATGYRVTMNSFLATGGDGFTVFASGTDQLGGDVDIDALEAYLAAHPALAPPAADRITRAG